MNRMPALLFPGQGSQAVGMGKALAQQYAIAARVFAEADEALGFALSTLCFAGPEDALRLTTNAQPAILATSIAALRPRCALLMSPATAWVSILPWSRPER